MILFYVLITALLLLGAAVLTANVCINNFIKKNKSFNTPKCVLAVFAHPDDEIMVAGSLAKWKKRGCKIHLLYFTHGEDGPTGGIVEKCKLGTEREKELSSVKKILNADSLTILNYPDRYLNTVAQSRLEEELLQKVKELSPDTVISFDNTIGLYGHTDHAFAGKCTQEALKNNLTCVKQLLIMTLGGKIIKLAKKMSSTFKNNYKDENGLPCANLSVSILCFGRQKKMVALAHLTQHQVVEDVQPMVKKIPYWLYYTIFSKEYFYFEGLTKQEENK